MAAGWEPCDRLERKRDLLMCLALHMENSPQCRESKKFRKTGIVVCESDSVQRVVSMWYSSEHMHAVERVMLSTQMTLRNCSIYLSRKPCSACTKFIIQAGISSVYYWPRYPELGDSVKDLEEVDQLFLRSSTFSSPFIPLIDHNIDMGKIADKTCRHKCEQCTNNYGKAFEKEGIETCCTLLNLESCGSKMENAFKHLDTLLHCSHGQFDRDMTESEREQHTHALQLCFLLAARSDDPQRGVGCLLYHKDGYFFGAGYNGYPIGALYGNLPRNDRNKDRKKEALVHAETNALLFRNKSTIEDSDICYCSKLPCNNCQMYLDFVGIKKIVFVEEQNPFNVQRLPSLEFIQWSSSPSSTTGKDEKEQDTPEKGSGPDCETNAEGTWDYEVCSLRLQEKRDLCIFLALLMEFSPCKKAEKYETGIVICEGDKFQRIIAVDASTEKLHAVQKALLMRPKSLKGCHIYLSRKPCIECMKFLVQAQVAHIYFWSNLEGDEDIDLHRLGNSILRESCIHRSMLTPVLDPEKAKAIVSLKTRTKGRYDKEVSSQLEALSSERGQNKILDKFDLPFLLKKESQEIFEKEIQNAKESFKILVGAKDRVLMEYNFEDNPDKVEVEEYMLHALQVCNLLAARSDTYSKGAGAVICKEKNIVAVGYKGFPRDSFYNLFLKGDVNEDKSTVICAEENVLILRSVDDLNGAELFATEKPCPKCELLIREVGIKRIIWPDRSELQPAERPQRIRTTERTGHESVETQASQPSAFSL